MPHPSLPTRTEGCGGFYPLHTWCQCVWPSPVACVAARRTVCRFPIHSPSSVPPLSCNISCVLRYGCPEAAVAEGAAPCTLQLCTFMYNTHVLKVTWKVTWVCPAPHCHLSHRQRTTHPCAPCPCTNREDLIGAARGLMSQSPPSHPKRRDPQVEPGRLSAARRLAAPRAAASGNSLSAARRWLVEWNRQVSEGWW